MSSIQEVESALRAIVAELGRINLPADRLLVKRLISKGQALRLQLVRLGAVDAVREFDLATVSVVIVSQPAAIELKQTNSSSERGQQDVAAPVTSVANNDSPGRFNLPVAFTSQTSVDVTPAAVAQPQEYPHRVFIQYAHVNAEYGDLARKLAAKLRADGIGAWLDVYDQTQSTGWATWMEDQITSARFVLVLCSKENSERFAKKQQPPHGTGATFEGHIIKQELLSAGMVNRKFIPVLLRPEDQQHVPTMFQAYTAYKVFLDTDYDKLVAVLTGQTRDIAPPVSETIRQIKGPTEHKS